MDSKSMSQSGTANGAANISNPGLEGIETAFCPFCNGSGVGDAGVSGCTLCGGTNRVPVENAPSCGRGSEHSNGCCECQGYNP